MTDVLTPEQRRRNMASIRGKDTRPEIIVRSLVHRDGYRYRLHDKKLPGKPDLVFSRRHKVIFVHGCFWHMHNCKYGNVIPATNKNFWISKRLANVNRDKGVRKALTNEGWDICIVWECKTRVPKTLPRRLRKFLGSPVWTH